MRKLKRLDSRCCRMSVQVIVSPWLVVTQPVATDPRAMTRSQPDDELRDERIRRRITQHKEKEAFPVIINHEDRSNAPFTSVSYDRVFRSSSVGVSGRHRY
jgi:hypothetical protein